MKKENQITNTLTNAQKNEIKTRFKRWKKAKEKYMKVFNKDSPSALSKEFNVFPSRIYFIADKEYKKKYREDNRLRYHKNKITKLGIKEDNMEITYNDIKERVERLTFNESFNEKTGNKEWNADFGVWNILIEEIVEDSLPYNSYKVEVNHNYSDFIGLEYTWHNFEDAKLGIKKFLVDFASACLGFTLEECMK